MTRESLKALMDEVRRDWYASRNDPGYHASLDEMYLDAILARLRLDAEAVRKAALEEAAQIAEACAPGFTSNYPDIAHDVEVATQRAQMIAVSIRALSAPPAAQDGEGK